MWTYAILTSWILVLYLVWGFSIVQSYTRKYHEFFCRLYCYECISWVVPDTDYCITCSTDTDSRMTCSTKYRYFAIIYLFRPSLSWRWVRDYVIFCTVYSTSFRMSLFKLVGWVGQCMHPLRFISTMPYWIITTLLSLLLTCLLWAPCFRMAFPLFQWRLVSMHGTCVQWVSAVTESGLLSNFPTPTYMLRIILLCCLLSYRVSSSFMHTRSSIYMLSTMPWGVWSPHWTRRCQRTRRRLS